MDINSNNSTSTQPSTFTPQDVPVGPVEVGPHHHNNHHHRHNDHHHHNHHHHHDDQGRVGEEGEYVEETL